MGGSEFIASEKSYDWLGPGVYFWENDPLRAYQWACLPWRKIERPSVVGAAINLGNCLDLTTQQGVESVRNAYRQLASLHAIAEKPLPQNTGTERGKRHLDCAVIKHLHRARRQMTEQDPTIAAYETVKALFVEGDELYQGAGFHDRTHTQICIINQRRIFGVFRLPSWQQSLLEFPTALYPFSMDQPASQT